MASIFQPALSEPDVSGASYVRPAPAVDTTTAQIIETVGTLGIEAAKGKAFAELTGTKPAVEAVTGEELLLPESVEQELNLTKIMAAREQGRLTAQTADARAQVALKGAINRHPHLAQELRQRYEQFFGGTGGVQRTFEEKLQEQLIEQEAKFKNKQRIEADALGIPLDVYQDQNRDTWSTTRLLQDLSLKASQADEENRSADLTATEVLTGVSGISRNIKKDIFSKIMLDVKNTGGVSPESKRDLLNMVEIQYSNAQEELDSKFSRHTSPSVINSARARLEEERAAAVRLVENNLLSDLVAENKQLLVDATKTQGTLDFPEIARIQAAGGDQAVKVYLDMLVNPNLSEWINTNDPRGRFVLQAGATGEVLGSAIRALYGAKKATDVDKALADRISVDVLSKPVTSEDEQVVIDKSLEYLKERSKEVPQTLNAYNSAETALKVMGNPAREKILKETIANVTNKLISDVVLSGASKNLIGIGPIEAPHILFRLGEFPATALQRGASFQLQSSNPEEVEEVQEGLRVLQTILLRYRDVLETSPEEYMTTFVEQAKAFQLPEPVVEIKPAPIPKELGPLMKQFYGGLAPARSAAIKEERKVRKVTRTEDGSLKVED